jgi:hypothetical protein
MIPVGFAELSMVFGGTALPYGAVCTQGIVPIDGMDGEENLEEIDGAITPLVVQTCSAETTLVETRLKYGPDDTGATYTRANNVNGNQGSGTEGPAVAGLVRKVVPGVSQRYAGRLYWPGLADEAVQTGGLLTPLTIADWQLRWDSFFTTLSTAGMSFVVFNDTAIPRTQSGYSVQARAATQRRRQRR